MKLEHLPYLFEINRLQSISAASRTMRIHQTTLSSIVKNIEDEIGYRIFQRSPSGVILSARGELFIKYAEEMYENYQEMIRLKPDMGQDASKPTCLTTAMLIADSALSISRMFNQRCKYCTPFFRELIPSTIIQRIEKEEANIGLTFLNDHDYYNHKRKDLMNIQLLGKTSTVMVVSKDHPLADKGSILISEIRNEKVVSTKRGFSNLALGCPLHPSNSITAIPDLDLVLYAVRMNNMITFLPAMLLPEPLDPSITTVELLGYPKENPLHLCLLTAKNARLTSQEQLLIGCIQDYFKAHTEMLAQDS